MRRSAMWCAWTCGAVAGAFAVAGFGAGAAAENQAGPYAPDDSPIVALGRRLFHDPTVSRTGKHSCGSCHDPEHGWSDARRVPVDFDGPMRRHSQPVTDLGGAGFHWDGEFASPKDLLTARLGDGAGARVSTTRIEGASRQPRKSDETPASSYGGGTVSGFPAALVHRALEPLAIAERLASDDRYAPAFRAAFGKQKIETAQVIEAIDAFLGSLRTGTNALDRHLAGDGRALDAAARRGLELFQGRAGCATCHSLDRGEDGRAALTDHGFHNTGVAFAERTAPADEAVAPQAGVVTVERLPGPDLGRSERSGVEAQTGAFKTPSLRDVARRAPYMHDASLATLEDVVRYYAKGGTPNGHLDERIRPFELSDGDVADLVSFLGALSAPERAGLQRPRDGDRSVRVTVRMPDGSPAARLQVQVVPFGERLGSGPAPSVAPSRFLWTSRDGTLDVPFPQTTHVLLTSADHEIAGGRPIPDCADAVEVIAAPRDRILVALRGADLPERLTATPIDPRDELVLGLPRGAGLATLAAPEGPQTEGPRLERERFEFERVRTLRPGEALYSAPLGRARVRLMLRFDVGGAQALGAPVDLDGGWSEPAILSRIATPKTKVETRNER